MVSIKKSALVLYSREEMFNLVDSVEDYEIFCPGAVELRSLKNLPKLQRHQLKLIIGVLNRPLQRKIISLPQKKWLSN